MTAGTREQAVVDANASILSLWPRRGGTQVITRAQNSLQRAGIYTIGALTDWTAAGLMACPNFGPGQLAEVRRVLKVAGLALKGDAL